jgi:hypothetical protein
MYEIANEDVTITVPLIMNGEFVVPLAGSVRYIVRGHSGSVLAGPTSIVTDENTTSVTITIPAALNVISGDVENRHLVVSFGTPSGSYQIGNTYRLVNWLNLAASAVDVRRFLGVTVDELPDDEVDLVKSYLTIKTEMGSVFTDALSATDSSVYAANDLVVYRTVLDVIPSLQLRVIQTEKSDILSASRSSKIDYGALAREASARYSAAARLVNPTVEDELTLFLVAGVDDPIVGEATS